MVRKDTSQVRGLSRRALLKTGALLGIAGVAGCTGDDDGETISIGTAGSGTPTEAAGQALARAMDQHSDVTVTVESTDGWTSNLYEYDADSFYAMGVDNNSLAHARDETGPFENEPVEDMPHLGFQYTTLDMYFVATEDSGIESTDDLIEGGYEVFPLEPGAGTRLSTEEILTETGIWEVNEMLSTDFGDIAGVVEEGQVDAMVIYGVNGVELTGWAQELDVRSGDALQAIEVGDDVQQAIEDHAGLELEEVEPYGWEQDVTEYTDTVSVWALIGRWALGPEISEEAAYEMTRVSSEHWETIAESDGTTLDHSDPETMTEGLLEDIPVHPGVAEFWEEEGVWDDSWERGETEG
jgi:TRAP transporter TAXI family solute receptor